MKKDTTKEDNLQTFLIEYMDNYADNLTMPKSDFLGDAIRLLAQVSIFNMKYGEILELKPLPTPNPKSK